MKGKKQIISQLPEGVRQKLNFGFSSPPTLDRGPVSCLLQKIKTHIQQRIGVLSRERFCAKSIVFCISSTLLAFYFSFLKKKSGPS